MADPFDDYAGKNWRDNDGTMPDEARGKRVGVELFSGSRYGAEPVSPACPLGWAADGKQGCDWHIHSPPRDTDIKRYYIC